MKKRDPEVWVMNCKFGLRHFVIIVVIIMCFLTPHLWHMDVPRLGVESELHLPAYPRATAMWGQSCVYDLHHSLWQCRILDQLSKARDRTHILMDASEIRFYCTTAGPLALHILNLRLPIDIQMLMLQRQLDI